MPTKKSTGETNQDWYNLWMNQSKLFFDVSNTHLKDMFSQDNHFRPQNHVPEIQAWLETLKKQWQVPGIDEHLKKFPNYAQMMSKMYLQAADMLFQKWMLSGKEGQALNNIHELYTLWVDSCHQVYSKEMHTKSFQEAYGEFMNASMNFWKTAIQG